MQGKKTLPRTKRAMMLALAVACGTVSACDFGLRDIRHNVVAGTAGFVKGYTTDFWYAVFPEWDDLLTGAED